MEWVWPSLAGFGLGLASSLVVLWIQRRADARSEHEYARKIVRSLVSEIEEGIARAKGLVKMLQNNTVSFSRIYTDLWRATNQELASKLEDPKVLVLLHRIYYRFDLVNFNFEHDRPGPAAAFAKDYLAEMEANLSNLKAVVEGW